MGEYTHKYISLMCHLQGSKRNIKHWQQSTPGTPILVSDTSLQSKEPRLLGEMVASGGEQRRTASAAHHPVPQE